MNPLSRYRSFFSIPFVRDIATMEVGKLVYMGLTLASSIVFARMLGLEGYGLYAVVLSFVATLRTFTNFGQSAALQVFFAEEYGKKNRAGMAAVLCCFVQVSLVNTTFVIAIAILAPLLSRAFYGGETVGHLARVLFLYNAVDWINSGMIIVAQAIREVRLKTILEQSAIAAFVLLAAASIVAGFGIEGIVWSQLIVSVVFVIVTMRVYRSLAPEHSLPSARDVWRVGSDKAWPYFKQGLWFSIDKNIGNLYPGGLFFVLSLVTTPAVVGIARISLQLANLPLTLLLPQVSELSTTVLAAITRDRADQLRRNAAKLIKHALFFHAIISFCALATLPFLIILFYGYAYADAIPMTLWLILLSLPAPLTLVNSSLMRLWRKAQYSAMASASILVVTWSLIYFLSPVIGSQKSFLLAFFLGQILPLVLTAYVFLVLLRPRRA